MKQRMAGKIMSAEVHCDIGPPSAQRISLDRLSQSQAGHREPPGSIRLQHSWSLSASSCRIEARSFCLFRPGTPALRQLWISPGKLFSNGFEKSFGMRFDGSTQIAVFSQVRRRHDLTNLCSSCPHHASGFRPIAGQGEKPAVETTFNWTGFDIGFDPDCHDRTSRLIWVYGLSPFP